ncbi:hypothetical protein I4U23_017077, partial [Adineta vaga]
IQIRHGNIFECMQSMVSIDAVNRNDIVAQTVRCSFDVHLLEIMGTVIIGGTLVMLRPDGILDLEYFTKVIKQKQINCIQAVPSEAFTIDLSNLLTNYTEEKCLTWNIYGPAETINSTFQPITALGNKTVIPIGLAMPNYLCLILDIYMQVTILDEEGELYIGGVCVFAGYLGRDDLTSKNSQYIPADIIVVVGNFYSYTFLI